MDSLPFSEWFRRRITWLTLCALLFGVTAPAFARAMASATGKVWIEICGVEGTKRIALDLDSGQTPAKAMATGDCPFCLLHNDVSTLAAPVEIGRFADVPLVVAACADENATWRLQFLWSAHLSRAPPSFS